MPGALSKKMNAIYEWCIDHIFILIGICIICMIIMQFTQKAHFANVKQYFAPRPPITLEQKRSPNAGGYNAPPVYNPPANNQPRTATRRR